MKKLSVLLVAAVLLNPISVRNAAAGEKLLIVASLFPQYDFARQVAGEKANVEMLLPPGVESHAFDLKPGDVKKLNEADVFIYTGKAMEPWAERILQSLDNGELVAVDASVGVELRKTHEHYGHSHEDGENHKRHDHDGHSHELDPHIWLDPTAAMTMVDNIAEGLCARDPENAQFYRANADRYKSELHTLDKDIAAVVDAAKRDTLVFGGRFAYAYFLARYKLDYVTAYDGCSMEGEPSLLRIAEVIRYMTRNDVRYLFHEEFVEPKVARSIARQTNAELLVFSMAHNLTKSEFESGVTYLDIMKSNLKNVERALR